MQTLIKCPGWGLRFCLSKKLPGQVSTDNLCITPWIVKPSQCQTIPLANKPSVDFHQVGFSSIASEFEITELFSAGVSHWQQVSHMTNQESLHYRMQINVIYPLKLWVNSILKDKNQNAIKKKIKRTKKLSPTPGPLWRHCSRCCLFSRTEGYFVYAAICFSDWQQQ